MKYSTIVVYGSVNLNQRKNLIIENLSDYLGEFATSLYSSSTFQFIKNGLNIDVKINQDEDNIEEIGKNAEYVKITNDGIAFYYFVESTRAIASQTINLSLRLDTLNTFKDYYSFLPSTFIRREHISRYKTRVRPNHIPTGSTKAIAIFDQNSEDLNPQLWKTNETKIDDYDSNAWSVIYRTTEGGLPSVSLLANNRVKIANAGSYTIDASSSFVSDYKCNLIRGCIFSINGGTPIETKRLLLIKYSFDTARYKYLQSDGTYTAEQVLSSGYSISFNRIIDIIRSINTNSLFEDDSDYDFTDRTLIQKSTSATYLDPISKVDRSLSNLVKIISSPYCPIEVTKTGDLYTFSARYFVMNEDNFLSIGTEDLEYSFIRNSLSSFDLSSYVVKDYQVQSESDLLVGANYLEDPKLYTSPFTRITLVYDSFVKPVNFEEYSFAFNGGSSDTINLVIDYKLSEAVTSALGFKAYLSPQHNYLTISQKEKSDFSNYLVCNRQNEKVLFNSDYLNYLRNGYNYDKKKQIQEIGFSALSSALSVLTAFGGGLTSKDGLSFGGAMSLPSNLTSLVKSVLVGSQEMEHTIDQLKKQSYNVSGSDDLPLLEWYSENKARINIYEMDDTGKNLVSNLFRYNGYSRNYYGIPYHNNRVFFDYLECDPVLSIGGVGKNLITGEYLNDIIAKHKEGVYYIHDRELDSLHYWDIELRYNNIELSLLPISF